MNCNFQSKLQSSKLQDSNKNSSEIKMDKSNNSSFYFDATFDNRLINSNQQHPQQHTFNYKIYDPNLLLTRAQFQNQFYLNAPKSNFDILKPAEDSCMYSSVARQENDETLRYKMNNEYVNTSYASNFISNEQQQQLINAFNKEYNHQISNPQSIQQSINSAGENVFNQKSKFAKKSRVLFSQWQINELEKLFKKQKYVTSNERDLMAKKLRLHANQVKIWFQNRRYKIKKKNESNKE